MCRRNASTLRQGFAAIVAGGEQPHLPGRPHRPTGLDRDPHRKNRVGPLRKEGGGCTLSVGRELKMEIPVKQSAGPVSNLGQMAYPATTKTERRVGKCEFYFMLAEH